MIGRAIGIAAVLLGAAAVAAQTTPPPTAEPHAVTWRPAPPVLPPRLVVQFGHDSPVDAAAFGPDNMVITADSSDGMVILWDAGSGHIIDRLPLPLIGRDGLVNIGSIRAIEVGAGSRTAIITLLAVSLPDARGHYTGERHRLELDLDNRRFAALAVPEIVAVAEAEAAAGDASPAPLPEAIGYDGKRRRLIRDGNALIVDRGDAGLRLGGTKKGYFDAAAMSPDGFRLARIALNPDTGRETNVWDSRSDLTLPGVATSAAHDRVGWIGSDRYFVAASNAAAPAIIADAVTGAVLAQVPAMCLMTPLGGDGMFVAVGPDECRGGFAEGKGLWFYERDDPAGIGFSLARHWQKRPLPAAAAREIITAITTGPSEKAIPGAYEIYAATHPPEPVKGVYPLSWLHVGSDPAQTIEFETFFGAREQKGLTSGQQIPRRLAVSRSGKVGLWAFAGEVRLINDAAPETGLQLATMVGETTLLDSDDTSVAVGAVADQALQRFDATSGARLASLPAPGVLTGGYIDRLPLLWAASNDGTLRLWDTRPATARQGTPAGWATTGDGAPLLSYYSFPGNRFFAVLPDGRYDTNLGADTDAVRWLLPHRASETLPAQVFMRSHYDPGLLRKLLACLADGDCTRAFPPLPDVGRLNRAVPTVRITAITPVPGAHAVTVDVETREGIMRIDGPIGSAAFRTSGAHDLRLFRNGQMVRQFPDLLMTPAIAGDDARWRAATALPKVRDTSPDCGNCFDVPATHRFTVPMSSTARHNDFSAYAFNEDRIKGPTETIKFARPPHAVPPRRPRAVIVAIGVDATADPAWRLNYAANDADLLAAALRRLPANADIVPIVLTSREGRDHARKADIEAVLRHLNGFATAADGKALRRLGLDPQALAPLTPDDIVILSFSGHGTTIAGEFYMMPSDARRRADGKVDPASLMSSTELTMWARRVESREMAMIIDACHSAASVDAGSFKPGPMGDPGLGQLAFDKGIRILAATQAADLAMEDSILGHGLLTHALVNDGLASDAAGRIAADDNGDGAVRLAEWLRFAVRRVPGLAAEVAARRGAVAGRDLEEIAPAAAPVRRSVQTPALFSFADEKRGNFIVRGALAAAPAVVPQVQP